MSVSIVMVVVGVENVQRREKAPAGAEVGAVVRGGRGMVVVVIIVRLARGRGGIVILALKETDPHGMGP